MLERLRLYKRTNANKVQVWWVELDGSRYRMCSGQVDGAITKSEWTQAVAKNKGRANETTPEEQAVREVESAYQKKRDAGYQDTQAEAEVAVAFSPMLAQIFEKRAAHVVDALISDKVFVQPKLDGIRCIATAQGLFSRKGKPLVAANHVHKALAPLFAEDPSLIFDGELYNHDLRDNFNKIVSLVKKTKVTEEERLESKRVVEYHVYDLPSHPGKFSRRIKELESLVKRISPTFVYLVRTAQARDMSYIAETYGSCLDDGYEGAMIRLDTKYEQKRSNSLLKYKPEWDDEFEIVKITEGKGNKAGMAGRLFVRLADGQVCKVNTTGTRKFLRRLLKRRKKAVGCKATVTYNGYTPDGLLRFPRLKIIHWTERL